MGLPASQRRALQEIEQGLQGSDPRLTSLFAIFTRLNREEEMPRAEQVRARAAFILSRVQLRLGAFSRWLGAEPRTTLRTAIFFPLALAAMTSTLLVGAALPGSGRCGVPPRASRSEQSGASPRGRVTLCNRAVRTPASLGS